MKIIEYKIFELNSADELERYVNECIEIGFFPIGNVSVSHSIFHGSTYSQVVVKYEEED